MVVVYLVFPMQGNQGGLGLQWLWFCYLVLFPMQTVILLQDECIYYVFLPLFPRETTSCLLARALLFKTSLVKGLFSLLVPIKLSFSMFFCSKNVRSIAVQNLVTFFFRHKKVVLLHIC